MKAKLKRLRLRLQFEVALDRQRRVVGKFLALVLAYHLSAVVHERPFIGSPILGNLIDRYRTVMSAHHGAHELAPFGFPSS